MEWLVGWLMFNDSSRDKDDMTVGMDPLRGYCKTGYDQSQGRRPSTLMCIGTKEIYRENRQKLFPNRTADRETIDGRSRRYVQYRVEQSQEQRP